MDEGVLPRRLLFLRYRNWSYTNASLTFLLALALGEKICIEASNIEVFHEEKCPGIGSFSIVIALTENFNEARVVLCIVE